MNVIGLDSSADMINKSRKTYPNCTFKKGDFMKSSVLKNKKYDHILSMYFIIYYIENKSKFFKKCYNLLNSGGYLLLHLVKEESLLRSERVRYLHFKLKFY